mgnify:CR=1 FL=1
MRITNPLSSLFGRKVGQQPVARPAAERAPGPLSPEELARQEKSRLAAAKHQGILNQEFAKTLEAADAGLVHCVSNSQSGIWYICNCCTCSCAILRGMAELGIANVVARSAYVNQIDEEACIGCGECLERCQFDALALDDSVVRVDGVRCVGCGVCVPACPQDALGLIPRADFSAPPLSESEWASAREIARQGHKRADC